MMQDLPGDWRTVSSEKLKILITRQASDKLKELIEWLSKEIMYTQDFIQNSGLHSKLKAACWAEVA